MQITSAVFEVSNTDVKKCPKNRIPEYAFIGRSNVGKSSLINLLTNNKKLAKTSSTPGKTQLINHFKINENWYLVDLPGYGYAQVSKKQRRGFQKFIKDYFLQREQLVCTFVLVDSRHRPQRIDLDFMEFLGRNEIPFFLLFTKTDKLTPSVLEKNLALYKKTFLEGAWDAFPKYFVTSSISKKGKDDVLACIHEINEMLKKETQKNN